MRKLSWSGFVLFGLLAGCASTPVKEEPSDATTEERREAEGGEEAEESIKNTTSEEGKAPVQPVVVSASPQAKDLIRIEGMRILRGVLDVSVSHGGGCKEHTYALAWDGTFGQGTDGTPVANLVLVHDAHEDRCKAMKYATPRFDLSPITQAFQQKFGKSTGAVDLALPGQATLRYEF
jgi:hypothetical protein